MKEYTNADIGEVTKDEIHIPCLDNQQERKYIISAHPNKVTHQSNQPLEAFTISNSFLTLLSYVSAMFHHLQTTVFDQTNFCFTSHSSFVSHPEY